MTKKSANKDLKNIKIEPAVFKRLARHVKKMHGRTYGHLGTEVGRFIDEGIKRDKEVVK